MKKYFITMILLCIGLVAFADGISKEDAQKRAQAFFTQNGNVMTKAGWPVLVWDGRDLAESQTKALGGAAPFYVFNNTTGGFVIIAGDDGANPILGYSYTGRFETEGMPDNIKWWFSTLAEQIAYIRANNLGPGINNDIPPYEPIKVVKNSLSEETALYNQISPYNDLCPMDGGDRSVTGCVATTMAIICRYYKCPATQLGVSLDSYSTDFNGNAVNIPQSGYAITWNYDWANMPTSYTGGETTAQNAAIARLMYDCGVSMRMNYHSNANNGSGASSAYIYRMMASKFGFDPNARYCSRSDYSRREWVQLVKSELDLDHPVPYDGSYTKDAKRYGHQFIVDGYATNNYFRINWGWGGYSNGYFALDAFGTAVDEIYINEQSVTVGLVPKKSEDPASARLEVLIRDKFNGLDYVNVDDILTDDIPISLFNMHVTFYNKGITAMEAGTDGRIWLGCRLVGNDGSNKNERALTYFTGAMGLDIGFNGTLTNINLSSWGTPAFGDKLILIYSNDAQTTWTPIKAYSNAVDALPIYNVPMIAVKATPSYTAGEHFDLKLTNYRQLYEADWYYDGIKVPDLQPDVVLTSGLHTIKAVVTYKDGTEETIVQEIEVP